MGARRLLAAGAVAGLVLLISPAPALAAVGKEITECFLERAREIERLAEARARDEGIPLDQAENEVIEEVELEECEEAPNPLLPDPKEIIWGVISFAVVLVIVAKFGVPAVRRGLQAREERIRGDLEQAEATRREAESILEQYRQQLADARAEAGRIIEEARQAADALRRDMHQKAEAEAAEARERAQAEIEAMVNRTRAELQREVANFAVTLAERVLERNLDREAQMALIDRYIEQVGGMSPNGGRTEGS